MASASAEPADWAKVAVITVERMSTDVDLYHQISMNLAIWKEVNEQKGRQITGPRLDEMSMHIVYEAWDPPAS